MVDITLLLHGHVRSNLAAQDITPRRMFGLVLEFRPNRSSFISHHSSVAKKELQDVCFEME